MADDTYWTEVHITMDPRHLEEISAALFALGCEGLEERDNGFLIYFDASYESKDIVQPLLKILQMADPQLSDENISIQRMPARNWNEEWKKSFRPFEAAPGLIIKPDWEAQQKENGQKSITIAPKMAFGTGHHETTRLMLQLMPEYLHQGDQVLDLGTGSGILAIYAMKCGAKMALGVDVDAEAIENFNENCSLNDLHENIRAVQGSWETLPAEKGYDLILANINTNTLLKLAPSVQGFAASGARLLLSGLMLRDEAGILDHYTREGWEHLRSVIDGDWVGMVFGIKN